MFFGKKEKIFTSYGRRDYDTVKPFVEVLRVPDRKVFLDRDSIPPGMKWRKEIERSLRKADVIFVFWTKNASKSVWVKREYELAIKLEKRIIPVLLDYTPLPPPLSEYQYIDFRDKFAAAGTNRQNVVAFSNSADKLLNPFPIPTLVLITVSIISLLGLLYSLDIGQFYNGLGSGSPTPYVNSNSQRQPSPPFSKKNDSFPLFNNENPEDKDTPEVNERPRQELNNEQSLHSEEIQFKLWGCQRRIDGLYCFVEFDTLNKPSNIMSSSTKAFIIDENKQIHSASKVNIVESRFAYIEIIFYTNDTNIKTSTFELQMELIFDSKVFPLTFRNLEIRR